MLTSIRKFSKSIFAKIFIAIIALPFVMWGMGDVFRSGKQNVIVEINNEKISSKEFVEHLQKINIFLFLVFFEKSCNNVNGGAIIILYFLFFFLSFCKKPLIEVIILYELGIPNIFQLPIKYLILDVII